MAKHLAFLVNSDRCIGCHACEMACKNEYQPEASVRMRKVYQMPEANLEKPARVFLSLACNHCEDPACLKACPAKAYKILENGIVYHDQEACIGCKMCIMACPYQVPCFDKETGKVRKCDMCMDKMEKGEEPVCVRSCVMDALSIIDVEEEGGKYADTVPGFPDRSITKPSTRFIPATIGQQIRRD